MTTCLMPSRRVRHRFGTTGEDHDGQRAVEEGDGRGEKTRVSDIVGEDAVLRQRMDSLDR